MISYRTYQGAPVIARNIFGCTISMLLLPAFPQS